MTLRKLNLFWKRIKDRDKRTFGKFYELYYPSLFSRAHKFISDYEVCEEIVQDTFIAFWDKADIILPEKKFMEAYLWRILKFKIADFYRGKKIDKHYLEENLEVSIEESKTYDSLFNEDLEKKIEVAIDTLPQKTKEAFIMSRINGMTYNEISEELNVSSKTIEYHISNALKILRKELKLYL